MPAAATTTTIDQQQNVDHPPVTTTKNAGLPQRRSEKYNLDFKKEHCGKQRD
jgi:hypothetical protein